MEFENKIKSLPIWKNLENIEPLEGGITNLNFLVSDSGSKSVVRLGSDIPEHLVYRSNEIIVSEAAYQIGVSPKLIYNEPGVLVLEFIESKTLEPKTVRENLNKIVPIIRKIHDEIPNKLSGQPQIFWVFYVIKYYSNYLLNNNSQIINLNIGTGVGTSVLELVETFQEVNKIKIPYQFCERRPGDVPILIADNKKASSLLQWEPRRDIKQMSRDGWKWQRLCPNGFDE